jgi:hypothetical protein
VLHVDDLVEPAPEQIAFARRLVLLRPHRVLSDTAIESQLAGAGNPKVKSQGSRAYHPKIFQAQTRHCAEN